MRWSSYFRTCLYSFKFTWPKLCDLNQVIFNLVRQANFFTGSPDYWESMFICICLGGWMGGFFLTWSFTVLISSVTPGGKVTLMLGSTVEKSKPPSWQTLHSFSTRRETTKNQEKWETLQQAECFCPRMWKNEENLQDIRKYFKDTDTNSLPQ